MKKLLVCAISLLLILAVGATALAAVSVQMTLTPDKTAVERGKTVTFTVSMAQLENGRAGGIAVHYDESVFTYVTGECLVTDATLKGFQFTNDVLSGVFACSDAQTLGGDIFRFTMKVNEKAALGKTEISITTSLRDLSGAVSSSAAPVTVTIKCNHSWSKWVGADANNHKKTCSLCFAEKTGSHGWDNGAVTKDPTCKETGIKTYTCVDCGGTRMEDLPKTEDHAFGAWSPADETTHKKVCTVCLAEKTDAHNWDEKETAAPNCTDEGYTLTVCTVCAYEKKETVPALGHDMTEIPAVAPTCKESGLTAGTSCQRCQAVGVAQNVVPATGHTYGDAVPQKAPTCTEAGYALATCTACGEEKQETVPALGHDMTKIPAVAPTCKESGLTAGTSCQRCQAVGTAQEEVAALGHSYQEGVCTVCGEPEGKSGDLDGIEGIDEDDAVYLLQHILMPDLFPVSQGVDYDNSGVVDEDDAVYLLQHILMPDLFPL